MARSMYKIKFRENVDTASLCTVELKDDDIIRLQSAIEDLYYFEFVAGVYAVEKNTKSNQRLIDLNLKLKMTFQWEDL